MKQYAVCMIDGAGDPTKTLGELYDSTEKAGEACVDLCREHETDTGVFELVPMGESS